MNTVYELNINTNKDLSNFVHELNVFRRQVALYPPAHPKTLTGADKILAELVKLRKYGDSISLGVTPDSLLFNGDHLDTDNPSCRDLGAFFSTLDIAVISFYQSLEATELIEFWRLLSDRTIGRSTTSLDSALKEYQINHIRLRITDYRTFTSDTETPELTTVKTDVWKEFVQSLIPGHDGVGVDDHGNHAEQLAQMLNNSANDTDCSALTSRLVHHLIEQSRRSADGIGRQLYEFSKKLKPNIRQSFHQDTLQTLDDRPDLAQEIIPVLPGDFISEALLSHTNKMQPLSTRLTDLLSTFAASALEKDCRRVIQSGQTATTQLQQADIELLMLEDQHHEYLPDQYQQALQKILAGNIQGNLPEVLAHKYRNSLSEQMIEHQCCAIIFDLLEMDADSETEGILQNNLIDMSRFFLDTGDFKALQKTLSRWMSFINSRRSITNLLTDRFYGSQTQDSFIGDVLRSIPTWHNEKYAEIIDYLTEVGEPYVEPLIDRLAEEKEIELRKIWMKLLLELGKTAHPAIVSALEDKRWYLVRNLLVILGQQRGSIPPKILLKLCEHPHPEVRCEALGILLRLNPPVAHRILIKELEKRNPKILKGLIPLVLLSNNDKAVNEMNRLLEAEPLNEANLDLKLDILANLSTAPQSACLLPVMRLIVRKEFFINRLRKRLQSAASETLRSYPRRQVISLLPELNEQQRTVIQQVLSSLPSSATGQTA